MEIEEKIKKLYDNGNGQKPHQIAKELQISLQETRNYLRAMNKRGEIQTEKQSNNKKDRWTAQKTKIQNRRNQILKLRMDGSKLSEISEILQVPISTVSNDIWLLRNEGKLPLKTKSQIEKEEARKKIKQGIVKLYSAGTKQNEMSEILQISPTTISNYIQKLKEQGELDEVEREKNIKKKIIENYRKALQEGKLKKEKPGKIKEIIHDSNRYNDIILYVKACIHFKEFQEAMDTLNDCIINDEGIFTR